MVTVLLVLMTVWQFYRLVDIMGVVRYELCLANTHRNTTEEELSEENKYELKGRKYIVYLSIEFVYWIIICGLFFTKAIAFAVTIALCKLAVSKILRMDFDTVTMALVIMLESVLSISFLVSSIILISWR